MRKIINNKVYDTATATWIGLSDNGHEYNALSYSGETLYRKRTGEYFLHGEGGPMTSYAVRTGSNNWRGSEWTPKLTRPSSARSPRMKARPRLPYPCARTPSKRCAAPPQKTARP